MADRSELTRKANELRQQAEREADASIRSRLIRMAEHYTHLVETESWSEAHPTTIASISEVFTRRD